jgi:hypothetical protein
MGGKKTNKKSKKPAAVQSTQGFIESFNNLVTEACVPCEQQIQAYRAQLLDKVAKFETPQQMVPS